MKTMIRLKLPIYKSICTLSPFEINHKQIASVLLIQPRRLLHENIKENEVYAPALNVYPQNALYDVKPSIRVEGLKPHRSITLKAHMFEDKGKLLYSNAHFTADKNGIVDVATSPSLGGSYEGIFPTGLLSMLKIATGNFEFGNIHKKNMSEPVKVKISLHDGHQHIDSNAEELDNIELNRYMIAEGVERIPVRDGNIRGVLYLPKGEGPFPGVIDMFGATGMLIESRAALNASKGIASLSLAYFSYEDIPTSRIHELDLTYFEEAIKYILSHPKIMSDRCGVIGNCFGGFLAYQMALYFKEVKAIFLINTTHKPFFGDLRHKGKIVTDWKKVGNIVREVSDGIFASSYEFNEALTAVSPSDIETFEKTGDDQHFFVAVGDEDCYQFHKGWLKFQEKISDKKQKNFSLKIYHKAGHIIQAPYSPFSSIVFAQLWQSDPKLKNGILMNFGGQPKETILMQEDVRKLIPDFINKHVTNV